MKKPIRHVLLVLGLLLSVAASANADILNCAIWPLLIDEESGMVLFYCENHTAAGPATNCNSSYPTYGWFDPTFDAWPEMCPDCSNSLVEYAQRDRSLPFRLKANQSLCSVLPDGMRLADGRCFNPRQGLTCICPHDIQVRSADGQQVISVRLFDATITPCCAGVAGKPRTIRIGFETERPVVATCRPFEGVSTEKSPYHLRVNYKGNDFIVLTKTPMTKESLASVTR